MMELQKNVTEYVKEIGAGLIGFAPVSRWCSDDILPDFHPNALWSDCKTVISISVPSLLPIVETKVSHLYQSQYDILNRRLDEIAYLVALFLNGRGHASLHVSRDGYGHQKMLRKNPCVAFSHVWAAYYAGLGTIGINQTLITREYGPRHRLVSVFTAAEMIGSPMLEKNLCNRCGTCIKMCPEGVFSQSEKNGRNNMDKVKCANQTFDGSPYNHCGFCIKTCPVGEDRKLYQVPKTQEYWAAHKEYAKWTIGLGGNLTVGDNNVFESK
jgi:epoxyqueuosine reductase QueG